MRKPHGETIDPLREKRFLERLRSRPELMERFEAILELTNCEGGELRTADQVEELLVEEVRRLGHGAMQGWAVRAEERSAGQLRQEVPGVRLRKKSPELVVHLWSDHH